MAVKALPLRAALVPHAALQLQESLVFAPHSPRPRLAGAARPPPTRSGCVDVISRVRQQWHVCLEESDTTVLHLVPRSAIPVDEAPAGGGCGSCSLDDTACGSLRTLGVIWFLRVSCLAGWGGGLSHLQGGQTPEFSTFWNVLV